MVWRLPGTTPEDAAEALATGLREQGFEVRKTPLGAGTQDAVTLAAEHSAGGRKVQAQLASRAQGAIHVNLGFEEIISP